MVERSDFDKMRNLVFFLLFLTDVFHILFWPKQRNIEILIGSLTVYNFILANSNFGFHRQYISNPVLSTAIKTRLRGHILLELS